jgi:hypothetical protein
VFAPHLKNNVSVDVFVFSGLRQVSAYLQQSLYDALDPTPHHTTPSDDI